VLDIGGGSTEATRKREGVSTPIGAVLLLETCGPDAAACRAKAKEAFAGFPDWGPLRWAVVGGTATAFAMLELGLAKYDSEAIEGLEVARARVTERIDQLAAMTPAELLAIPGLGQGRADIVIPGLCILEAFLTQTRQDKALISDRGIRYGLLVDWLRRRHAAVA
jgi:exopolyphosphatase/guanosine-5'-triphosphate,3'-diphosphate pyrophosphatase